MKSAKLQKTKLQTVPTIRFNTKLSESTSATKKAYSWSLITLPKSASAKLPSSSQPRKPSRSTSRPAGRIMVEGVINCIPFRAALESHQLKVSKAMQTAVGIAAGDTVTVEITRVADEPETRVPADLRKALAADPQAFASWIDITPLSRRDWIFSICSARQAETRARRVEKTRDMLAEGKRRLCCFPGITWMMKENAKACGMWQKLGKVKKPV